jgi:hypothetical protein
MTIRLNPLALAAMFAIGVVSGWALAQAPVTAVDVHQ